MVKTKILLIFALLFIHPLIYPQGQKDFTEEFNRAIQMYNAQNYQQALNIFSKIADDPVLNSKTTISFLFKGKSLLHLNNFPEAINVLLRFLELYPTSDYADEARLTIAKTYYEEKDYFNSFKEYVNLIITSNSSFYVSYAKAAGEKIAENFLLSYDVQRIYDKTAIQKVKPYLLLVLAKININEYDLTSAKQDLDGIIQTYPNSEEKGEAILLDQKIRNFNIPNEKNTQLSSSLIGVILPLGGEKVDAEAAAVSLQILDGIKYAVSEYNSENEKNRIGILIENTERSRNKIDSIKDEFENIPNIKAVIGPIFSDEVRIVLNDFKDSDIPIISPTATDTGLTFINRNFFQANPSFSLRGKVIADYIYNVENKKKAGVLYSTDGYSPLLASTFIDEYQKIGGEIIVSASYKSNSFSLNEPVSRIAAFQDSLQCLYVPLADKIDAPVIFSQLIQDSTILPIFGNQDWFYAKGYESAPALSNQLTFSSDYFINYSDSTFIKFSRNFFNKAGIDPNRNTLYGYDLAKYLLSVLQNSSSRSAAKMKMESGFVSEGFHNNISFDKEHINNFLNILRYNGGKFQLVTKYRSSN